MTNREEGEYSEAIHYRIQNPQTPFPDAPVICVRPEADGTTLAIARYKPTKDNQKQIDDIIRLAVIEAHPDHYQWQSTSTPTNPLIAIKTGAITGLITLSILLLTQQEQSIIPIASVFSLITATIATIVRGHRSKTSQADAISEITGRVNNYSPKNHPINRTEIVHSHDQGLSIMVFPDGLGTVIEPSRSAQPNERQD